MFVPGAQAGTKPAPPVSLYLNVEKDGNLISGLQEANFRLYLDGKPQKFRLEAPETPASVALLVEYSRSSRSYPEDVSACMQGFQNHAPEDHWYALAVYSYRLDVLADFTRRKADITAAYTPLTSQMGNEIEAYDTVYEMLEKMGRLPGRRILILIASGMDTFSGYTLEDVRKKAEAENVTIFAAGLGSALRGGYNPSLSMPGTVKFSQAEAFLQMLARATGGYAWFPNQPAAYSDVMQGVMQSIATQYRLVYEAPARPTGKVQEIKVEAFRIIEDKREDFDVLVREHWR